MLELIGVVFFVVVLCAVGKLALTLILLPFQILVIALKLLLFVILAPVFAVVGLALGLVGIVLAVTVLLPLMIYHALQLIVGGLLAPRWASDAEKEQP